MNRFALFLCLPFSILSTALYGQSDTSRVLDTLRIQEVPFSPIRSSRPMQILDSNDLQMSQASNVADALRHMAGVQLRDYGGLGGMKTLDVRSMGGHHTGLIYNGMPVNNAQNGMADLGRFSLNNLSAIRLYNGQPGDLSLPARAFASASTLILDPTDPNIEQGRSSLQVQLKAGSFGLLNPALDWEQGLSERTSYRISTEWKQWDGGYPYRQNLGIQRDSLMNRMNSDMQALRIESIFQGSLDRFRTWSVNAYAYLAQRGLPGASITNNFYRKDRQWDEDIFLQGNIQAYHADNYRLYLYGKYRYHTLRYLNPEASTSQGYIDNRYFEHSIDLSAVQTYRWNASWTSALATDYTFQTLDANLRSFAYPRRHTALLNLSTVWEKGPWHVQGNVLGTIWKEQSRYQQAVEQKPILSPSLAASYRPWAGENLYFRLFYKSIFRMPTFNDRYYTLVGSVDLKPEYTRQYNVGITWLKTWTNKLQTQGTLDLYRNHIRDRITAIPTSNIFLWTMVNLGQVEISGMDLSLQADWSSSETLSWQAGLQYTWQDARDQTPQGYHKGSQIPYAPEHSGSATVSVAWQHWGIRYAADYTGMRYSQRWNAPENELDSWWIQDAAVSYKSNLFSVPLRLIASAHNLGNVRYAVIPNFPMPGRYYSIQLQIQL